jgi:hypothetical protein
VVDLRHDDCWLVANHFGKAKVLVGPAVTKIRGQLRLDLRKCCC